MGVVKVWLLVVVLGVLGGCAVGMGSDLRGSVESTGRGKALRIPLSAQLTQSLTMPSKFISTGPSEKLPIQGNLTYWGEYFTTIGVGTPPQWVNLQLDTGSSDIILYSADCTGCGSVSADYDATRSRTSEPIYCDNPDYICKVTKCDGSQTCTWQDRFGDGSMIDGTVVLDYITLDSLRSSNMVAVGKIEGVDAPGGFEATGVDGIWGLAYGGLSGWSDSDSLSQLFKDLDLYNSFDLCLYTNGGVMHLGDDYSENPAFQWTPIVGQLWYSVYLTDWLVGGHSIGVSQTSLNQNGVIIDSGTTLLIVNPTIYSIIKTYLLSQCTSTSLVGVCNIRSGYSLFDGKCYPMTDAQVQRFPNITLVFEDMEGLTITGFDYLWQGAGSSGVYCLGIQSYTGLPIIIGDIFLKKFHVVFDREEETIGFGPLSTCKL